MAICRCLLSTGCGSIAVHREAVQPSSFYQEADLLLSSCYADRYQEVAAFGSSRRDLLLSRLFIKQGTRLSFAPEIER
jgi:hypothetical protein